MTSSVLTTYHQALLHRDRVPQSRLDRHIFSVFPQRQHHSTMEFPHPTTLIIKTGTDSDSFSRALNDDNVLRIGQPQDEQPIFYMYTSQLLTLVQYLNLLGSVPDSYFHCNAPIPGSLSTYLWKKKKKNIASYG